MSPERWQRIEQLYHEALERAADERAAFLAEACAGDETLRREVEALLAANEQASGFLTVPALQLQAQDMAAEKATAPLGSPVGLQLSHYKILARIGAGGMGEVYLARDATLERRVALKLLPVKFTQDAERLQRFVREAKAASALNHPNIITIYEIGEAATATGKTHFIATEFIEGETLRRRIAGEALTLREALEIAIQVAAALDAAHKAGIVHRDIKPENLMVRPDGLVKVLDFGLAKLTPPQTAGAKQVDTDAQTLIGEMKTQPGTILGTLRYMSPEQARGRALDTRTDIFSLGVVLYELLTGQPLFNGETSADVIAAIIHQEPTPLTDYVPDAPPELERIVRKALAKDSRERYQTARDLQIDMQTLKQESELSARLARSGQSHSLSSGKLAVAVESQAAVLRFPLRHARWVLPVVLLVCGALWWWLVGRHGQVEAPPPASLKTTEVFTWQSAIGEVNSLGSFSPDGKWVAFTSFKGGTSSIWVKQAMAGDAEQSTKDEFPNRNPVWSPNGEEIAYVSMRPDQPGIWRKPPFGGTPILLKALAMNNAGVQLRAWSRSGATIYYELKQNLFALEVGTGAIKQLTSFDATQVIQNTISISPDEQHIAYSSKSGQEAFIWTVPVSGGSPKRLTKLSALASKTVWHSDNNRIFFSASMGRASQIFVADRAGRQAVQLTFGDQDIRVLDVSADGTKVLYGSSMEESNLWGVQVTQAEEFAVASEIGFEFWPDVSPNNQTVAYQYVRNLNQGNNLYQSSILTKSVGSASRPVALVKEGVWPKWAPDGKRLAFRRRQGSEDSLWTINVNSGEEKQLVKGILSGINATALPYNRMQAINFDWSPDSSQLVYSVGANGLFNLWIVAADGASNAQVTYHNESGLNANSPCWSADGKRLAYLIQAPKAVAGLWVAEVGTKNSRTVLPESSLLRLLGWSQQDKELVIAKRPPGADNMFPSEISLLRISVTTGEQHAIAVLPNTYLHNIHLSANKQTIAFVSRQDGKDNVWVLPVVGGAPKKLTNNTDPQLYLSSLAWSPDGRAIFFGKQTKHNVIAMLTNFE